MPLLGFEPTISAGERLQNYALDRTVTGTGKNFVSNRLFLPNSSTQGDKFSYSVYRVNIRLHSRGLDGRETKNEQNPKRYKLSLCTSRRYIWKWSYSSTHSYTVGPRWRWVFNVTPRPLYPRGKRCTQPMNIRLNGLQIRSGRFGQEKLEKHFFVEN